MLFSILESTDKIATLISLLLSLPVILFSLSLHEFMHGFAAYKCGDKTAYNLGRLTLNPLAHLDPIGFLCMVVFGFGWAKPVPINSRYFNNPRRDIALVAAAGPLSNFVLGIIFAFCYIPLALLYQKNGLFVISIISLIFYIGSYLNFMLAIFNLLPIPPFDGSRIFSSIIPTRWYFKLLPYERQIMIGVLVILLLSSRIFYFSPVSYLSHLLTNVFCNLFYKLFAMIFPALTL